MSRCAFLPPIAALLVSCIGDIGGGNPGGSPTLAPADDNACGPSAANKAVMDKLRGPCAGCHTSGTIPYFSSLANFETLLVYNEKYVVAGQPDKSYLLALLRGQGAPPLNQMPIGQASFAALAEQGKTEISMAELEEWITNLAGAAVVTPDPAAPTVQRMSAEQIRDTLYKQLGLSNADFFNGSDGIGSHGIPEHLSHGEGNYPV